MKINLRQEGKLVCRLEVLEHGALVIRVPSNAASKELQLSVRDSRRIAGAIVENSIKGTLHTARSNIRRQARAQLDELLGALDGEEDDDDG